LKPEDIKVEPSGLIKNPRIVMMKDGPDHKNWIELGEKKAIPEVEGKFGYYCCVVSYAPNFGHLWQTGYIDDENLAQLEKGDKFSWYKTGIAGHGCP